MNSITNFGDGRLGNQMFQYAFLFAKQRDHGIDFFVPRTDLSAVFDITPSTHNDYEKACKVTQVLSERHSIVFDLNCQIERNPCRYQGYFQSYRYFQDHFDAIRKQFVFRSPVRMVEDISQKSLCIHIRRTDYLHSHMEDYWGNLWKDGYYERAMEMAGSFDSIYVCSDDIDWCKEQTLFQRPNVTFVVAEPSRTLQLMASVHTNIISNSTFAWWGAFLNSRQNVFIPQFWRGPAAKRDMGYEYYSYDLVVPGWKVVPVYESKVC